MIVLVRPSPYIQLFVFLFATTHVLAQGYVDQHRSAPLLYCHRVTDDSALKPVQWHEYLYADKIDSNGKGAWSELMDHLDSLPGLHRGVRKYIVCFANRATRDFLKDSSVIIVPDSFVEDYRAYTPYPLHYSVADTFPKLFIIDKFTQTFGAYEYGFLVRWGVLSSGARNHKTPVGRYNFIWKKKLRYSSAAPPGQVWKLPFMFNFHVKKGLHVHQYKLPMARAASHGCVRLAMDDAVWNYYWANAWQRVGDSVVRNGTPVMVVNTNPVPNVARHWKLENGQVISLMQLPDDPEELPLGTYVQELAPWDSGW